jgi:uncharacterized cupredoxin-like copper-binding protein
MRFLLAAVLAAGLLAADASAAATVNVRLNEFRLILSTKTVKAGQVTFVVKNVGKLEHSFVVLKTTRAPGKLRQRGNVAVEEGRVGRIAPFKPGQTRRLTLTLRPGKYVLICNMPLHYKAGQYAGFTVT